MIDDGPEGFEADVALADFFMPVFVAGQLVLAVVHVDGFQPIQADDLIKSRQYVVQMVDDIVAAVKDVARIEADADFIVHGHFVDDGRQFFKGPAHFRPLAGHGFQEDRRLLAGEHTGVEHVGNEGDARFSALADVAAGMEIIAAVVNVFQTAQVVGHGLAGEIPRLGRLRAAVQGIRRMGQDGREVMGCHELVQGLYIVDVQFADATAAGIAGEELERICPYR